MKNKIIRQQTKQTFQRGSGDVLNDSPKRSGRLLEIKTADDSQLEKLCKWKKIMMKPRNRNKYECSDCNGYDLTCTANPNRINSIYNQNG